MILGPYILGPDAPDYGIYEGDAHYLAETIPDESIDLILADPVYQNIDDYLWLAKMGARVLKHGGSVLAQTGQEYMPNCLQAMAEYLDYVWVIVERLTGPTGRLWGKRIFSAYKPWLWFSKGKRMGRWVRDCISGQYDKQRHDWGDGAGFIIPIVGALCSKDGIVFDPFTGSGTVPAVCKMLGRHYLAFEIDPKTYVLARNRLRDTQAPLFVTEKQDMLFDI